MTKTEQLIKSAEDMDLDWLSGIQSDTDTGIIVAVWHRTRKLDYDIIEIYYSHTGFWLDKFGECIHLEEDSNYYG